MRWIDVRKLKNLRRFPVPPEVLAAGRVRLIAVIEASPMSRRQSAWFMSAAWRPVMAAMLVIVVATGGGTVVAAHDALPGERLYVVKLAAEEVSERMTFTAERRFVVQAAHASRRLEETERLLELQGIGGDIRAERVRSAMDRYEGHLFVMNEIAVRLDADPENPKKGKRAREAAEGMFDLHAHLIESATRAEAGVASLMLDPIDATISLEDDVNAAIPADDGGMDGEDRVTGRSRAERINESLKRLRAGLEERRVRDDEDRRVPDRDDEDAVRLLRDDEDSKTGIGIEVDSRLDVEVKKPLEMRVGM